MMIVSQVLSKEKQKRFCHQAVMTCDKGLRSHDWFDVGVGNAGRENIHVLK